MVNRDAVAVAAFKRVSKYQHGQIVTLASAFLFSTAACLSLSYVNYVLSPDCVLDAQWKGAIRRIHAPTEKPAASNSMNDTYQLKQDWLKSTEESGKDVLELDVHQTKWGKKNRCFVTQYGYAAAAVASFILCWFFVFFRPTKEAYYYKKKTAASKLIIPGIVFALAFTICVFVAAVTLQIGFVTWCNSVSEIRDVGSCSSVENFALKHTPVKLVDSNYYSLLIAGQVFAWLGAFAWLFNMVILSTRCYLHVDFPDYFFEHSVLRNDTVRTDIDHD